MIRSASKAAEIKSQANLVADLASGIFWLPTNTDDNEAIKATRDTLCRHMRDAIDKLSVMMSQYDRLADIEAGKATRELVRVEVMQDGGDFYDVRAERTLWRFAFPVWDGDTAGARQARKKFEVYCAAQGMQAVYVGEAPLPRPRLGLPKSI